MSSTEDESQIGQSREPARHEHGPEPSGPDQFSDPALDALAVRAVRRAADWFAAQVAAWRTEPTREYENATLSLMDLLAANASAVLSLAESPVEQAPAALAISRSCFETGLTCAWLLGDRDATPGVDWEEAILRRWLGLHEAAGKWMRRVAREADDVGFGDTADRWNNGALRREQLLEKASRKLQLQDGEPTQRPNVAELCRRAQLSRLYHGYRLSSQFTHGTLMGAEEFASMVEDHRVGRPHGPEWLLPLSMVVWGFELSVGAYARRPRASDVFDATPLREASQALGTTPADE
jgi:hypothetical protein